MLNKVRLDLYFIDWLDFQSSGKRLTLDFIDWLAIQSLAKTNFISPYKQDILILTDFFGVLMFRPIQKIKKTRWARQFF